MRVSQNLDLGSNVSYNFFTFSTVLFNVRRDNQGFRELRVLRVSQELREPRALWRPCVAPDPVDDGSSVLGYTITQKITGTVDKYM